MSRFTRFATASAIVAAVAVTPVAAFGQSVGTSGGDAPSPSPTVLDNTATRPVDVAPSTPVAQTPTTAAPAATPAASPSGSLPFTGGDVAGFVIAGGALVAIGGVAVAASRRRTVTA
jgi:hypothetical protein